MKSSSAHPPVPIKGILTFLLAFLATSGVVFAQNTSTSTGNVDVHPYEGSIAAFSVDQSDLVIAQEASPYSYFDQTGQNFAILGNEAGEFEAWAWPLKLFIHFDLSFYIGSSTEPILGREIATSIEVRPDVTSITYVFQSFTAVAHIIVPPEEAGAVLLLDIDSTEPLNVVASFVPTMQPMWPAGIGGQYARWDDSIKAYLISESSRKNHGYLGSPAGKNMSYTPAHMLGENPNQFKIEVPDPSLLKDRFIPIVMAGGKGDRAPVLELYQKLASNPQAAYEAAHHHSMAFQASTLSINTPEPTLNDALEWAKFSYEGLFAQNPDLQGTGMLAGLAQAGMGGRPGFGWFFGGDSYVNSFSLNSLGALDRSREAITFMAPYQRADGKMPHELTQASDYVDWFGDYPYAFIHADTSPYFIVAMHAYYEASGDWDTVNTYWDQLKRAFEWSLSTDLDNDGLMDNAAAGLGALEFGAFIGIQTDIYLAAVWIQAIRAMNLMATLKQDHALTSSTQHLLPKAQAAFEKFWDPSLGQYAYAFNKDGETVSEVTPWSSVALLFGEGQENRALSSLRRMGRSDLTTDWGTRMLSTASDFYEPLNYNYGAVWPFLTSWVTTAQFKRGLPLQGYSNLMASVGHVVGRSLGDISEVYSGARHTWPQESVPHQGFATAATVLPAVQGLFGLSYSHSANTLTFAPAVPATWDWYNVSNVKMNTWKANIAYSRSLNQDRYVIESQKVHAASNEDDRVMLSFTPRFLPGTQISSVTVNGKQVAFTSKKHSDTVQLFTTFQLTESSTEIIIQVKRTVEIAPPVWNSKVGSENIGLRIVSFDVNNQVAELEVEGLAGENYELDLRQSDRIRSVDGASVKNGKLLITFSDETAAGSEFQIKTIRFQLSN